MAHVSYDVSDRLSWFGEVAYSSSDALGTPANGGLGPTGLTDPGGQRVSHAGRRERRSAPTAETERLARIFMPDVINALNTTENETTRFVTGLEGELGSEWTWDVYYQHGKNENHQRLFNNMVGSLAGGGRQAARLPALGARRRGQSGQPEPRSSAARRSPAIRRSARTRPAACR